jgi:hypothetical protein
VAVLVRQAAFDRVSVPRDFKLEMQALSIHLR